MQKKLFHTLLVTAIVAGFSTTSEGAKPSIISLQDCQNAVSTWAKKNGNFFSNVRVETNKTWQGNTGVSVCMADWCNSLGIGKHCSSSGTMNLYAWNPNKLSEDENTCLKTLDVEMFPDAEKPYCRGEYGWIQPSP